MEDILTDIAEPPLRTAGIAIRFAAAWIDSMIWGSIGAAMCFIWGDKNAEGNYELTGFPAFILFGIIFALIPLMEGLKGQTLGKRACKIKVIKNDGTPSGVGHSIVRHLLGFFDYILLIGFFVALSNKKRRRIGDLVAGTRVVYQ